MATRLIEAPIGPIELEAEGGALVRLTMLPKATKTEKAKGESGEARDEAVLDETVRQLGEYFAGRRRVFDLPLKPEGSAFRLKVWQALREIPYGEQRRYGDLAAKLKTAARAIGGACGANPIGIIVPCHRVVGGQGWLGGFSGGDGSDTKRFLLGLESSGPLFANHQDETDRETPHARTHDHDRRQGRRQIPGLPRHA